MKGQPRRLGATLLGPAHRAGMSLQEKGVQSSPSALVKQGTHSVKETGHRTESLKALLVGTDFI